LQATDSGDYAFAESVCRCLLRATAFVCEFVGEYCRRLCEFAGDYCRRPIQATIAGDDCLNLQANIAGDCVILQATLAGDRFRQL